MMSCRVFRQILSATVSRGLTGLFVVAWGKLVPSLPSFPQTIDACWAGICFCGVSACSVFRVHRIVTRGTRHPPAFHRGLGTQSDLLLFCVVLKVCLLRVSFRVVSCVLANQVDFLSVIYE